MGFEFATQWLGVTPYLQAHELQLKLSAQIRDRNSVQPLVHVLGLEHDDVITLGSRGDAARDLRWSVDELSHRGIEVQLADRGGQATLHSRGQLVIYPLLALTPMSLGVRAYVELLQKTTMELLEELGIESFLGEEPGVYTSRGKIAFCGVRVERGVTRHGISINVRNDLNLFSSIVPCGLLHQKMDAICFHDVDLSLEELFERWSRLFRKSFQEQGQ